MAQTEQTSDTLPPSFLHVTLATPYRSTIAITRLACFIAECKGLFVPEGDFGSDVEGTKPIFYDVGVDERKMKEALDHCKKHLGNDATILHDQFIPDSIEKMVKEQGKAAGGPWDCYDALDYFGWEDERVVAVTNGFNIMELITRARTHLSVIIVGEGFLFAKTKEYFRQAAGLGLVEQVQLGEDSLEIIQGNDVAET